MPIVLTLKTAGPPVVPPTPKAPPSPKDRPTAAGHTSARSSPAGTAPRNERPQEHPHQGRPYLLGSLHPATEELRELAGTLGLRLVSEVYQSRDRPHPGTFFGKGKLEEVKAAVSDLKAGIRPEGWTWNGEEFVTEEAEEDPSAWGGTGWVRGHRHGDEGRGPPGEKGRGDPLGSAAWGGRQGEVFAPEADEDTRRDGRGHGTDKGRGDGGDAGAAARDGPETRGGAGRRGSAAPPGADGPDLHAWAKRDYLLILDEDVRPAVLFNLEERLGVEVWDRSRLILEIFGQHAHVKEARLQVELAMLQYEIPLIHEAVHRKRSGERPGFLGGGEYDVADYEDFIKRRMRSVKDELEKIRQERDVRRKVRRERFYLISLAGYTNAGKSSLLNALTGAEVHEKWEMFSTLETTTRRMTTTSELRRQAEARQGSDVRDGRDVTAGGGLTTEGVTGEDTTAESGTTKEGTTAESGTTNEGTTAESGTTKEGTTAESGTTKEGTTAQEGTTTERGAEGAYDNDPGRPSEGGDREEAHNVYTRPVLLTDTVGFIQALPSWLLNAFRSTLEEISLSDVVLLVADVSDPVDVLMEKIRVARSELAYLDVTCPIVLVLNKADLVPDAAVAAKRHRLIRAGLAREDLMTATSSKTMVGIGDLVQEIDRVLPDLVHYEARLPMDDKGQRLMSLLYDWGEVRRVDYGQEILVRGLCDPLYWKDLLGEALTVDAEVSRLAS